MPSEDDPVKLRARWFAGSKQVAMTTASHATGADHPESELKRSITGRLLFFYVLGDVLGSGIYVLIGAVAAAVGGAFWIAFAAGVTMAAITGLAYAELVTKYPQAAGAALYVNKAFRKPMLTFLITICMLSASFAASGSLASGFARYFGQLFPLPPAAARHDRLRPDPDRRSTTSASPSRWWPT